MRDEQTDEEVELLRETVLPFVRYGRAREEVFGKNSRQGYLTSVVSGGKWSASLIEADWVRLLEAAEELELELELGLKEKENDNK